MLPLLPAMVIEPHDHDVDDDNFKDDYDAAADVDIFKDSEPTATTPFPLL